MLMDSAELFFVLAAIAMTFVGFATIVITLRQGAGLPVTPFQLLTAKQFIEFGFMACGFALLPPILAVCGMSEDLNWRLSSAAIVAVRAPLFALYPRRRRAVEPVAPLPTRYKLNLALFSVIAVALVLNLIGWPYQPQAAPVVVAVAHTLAVAAWLFLQTFNLFLDR